METLKDILSKHLVFKDLKPEYIEFLSSCASEEAFAGGTFIFKTGEPAEDFYLVNTGQVALEVYSPPKGAVNIMTLNTNDILGWSWLFPPHLWHFEARALADVNLFAFDGVKIRRECRRDFEFGYNFTNCFGQIMMQRLAATRLQLLDVFGPDNDFQRIMI